MWAHLLRCAKWPMSTDTQSCTKKRVVLLKVGEASEGLWRVSDMIDVFDQVNGGAVQLMP